MIIAVGFKVNNERAVRFRKWANQIVKDYTIQGWAMDKERLKKYGTILTKDYFEKQLEVIREIRLSERRFYQKITDIYSTALDYDPTAKTTRDFFKKVQNKLHWAIHGHTAAELIYTRADAEKQNMGLQTWAAAPSGKIVKSDTIVAKNYLYGCCPTTRRNGIRKVSHRSRSSFHERFRQVPCIGGRMQGNPIG